jgi:hypothetical protein
MRDEHLAKYHAVNATKALPSQTPLDVDDIQPLLFDLVRADEVDAVREFFPAFDNLHSNIRYELRNFAASSGSTTMIDMLFLGGHYNDDTHVRKAIEGLNLDVFKYLLGQYTESCVSRFFRDVLDSGSEPIFEIWKSYFDLQLLNGSDLPDLGLYSDPGYRTFLKKVHGNPEKESWVISVWEKVRLEKGFTADVLGHTLVKIAETACSVRLARYLVDHGADVNHAPTACLPPVRHAARTDSATAAELMKFLLLQGADPNAGPSRLRKIQDEKGPKSIAKWLGMSWDELVVQTREERERAIQANSATMLPVRAGAETGHEIL